MPLPLLSEARLQAKNNLWFGEIQPELPAVTLSADNRLYKTRATLKRTLRVCYPAGTGKVVLRTEANWDRNIEPISVGDDGNSSTFELSADQPYLYFKPCLIRNGNANWAVGPNNLLLMGEKDDRICYPFFFSPELGRFSPLIELPSKILNRTHRLRAYLPPGYEENTLSNYPVVYMQDGQNLFFPDEAFMGHDWAVNDTSQTLRAMRAVEDMIIVGVYSDDRIKEYTQPGYENYARSLVDEIVPKERAILRTADSRRFRTVCGSSLGGVVSFYTAWQYPDVFGSAACMSSTFSHKDDLIERVLTEPRRDLGFYLDSGWPGDNYEVTMAMATALVSRGWRYGWNLLHLCFPQAAHNENAWGVRFHIPMQFFNGAVARASRALTHVLGDDPKLGK
jgi:predicted alpha/beta superfamily hydrolase